MERNIWDELNFYGIVDEMADKYGDEEKIKIKNKFKSVYGTKFDNTIFSNDDFFTNFINTISSDEQEKYIKNTIEYAYNSQKENYDPNYVIVTRRAVPSYESKPESFWTTAPFEAIMGLKQEISGDQRMHSVIMVSTLKK